MRLCPRLLVIPLLVCVTLPTLTGCYYTRRDPDSGEKIEISRREYESLRRHDAPRIRPMEPPVAE